MGSTQQVYLEPGTIDLLGDILHRFDPQSVLLVADRAACELSGAGAALSKVLAPYEVRSFGDFGLNPKLADVEKGLAFAREQAFDVVIAVGGGSALDMAKLIRIMAAQEASPGEIVHSRDHIRRRGQPLIAIPTTAGTGSEATQFAVVYVGGSKRSLEHEFVLPDVAVVDPLLTHSLPPRIAAATGMDALSQALESFWSVNSTAESRADAREAIRLCLANLRRAVHEGAAEARQAMSNAAYLAGRAINVTKTTAPHAVSYTMTSHFGVPHGHAVSLTLGEFLVYNSQVSDQDVTDGRGVAHVRAIIGELNGLLGRPHAAGACESIGRLMQSIGLETRLSQVGIRSAADRELIAAGVNLERLVNNPRRLTQNALRELLARIA